MFSYERVQTLNQLELFVYKYVSSHLEECKDMTIRELSAESHVSSTTILRFLKKMGFAGFSDFKCVLRHQDEENQMGDLTQELGPVGQFLKSAHSVEYGEKLNQVAHIIAQAHTRLFFGMGSSGSMAQYGARILSNYGLLTLAMTDPYQPQPISERDYSKTLIILLSVSGETKDVLRQANYYRENGAKTLAITANCTSTLAQLVDVCLSYDIPETKAGSLNFTSQIPTVFLLEQIGQRTNMLIHASKVSQKI